jgi:hypothetical protein
MSDLPEQPTQEELEQFEQAPEAPVLAEDNTEGVSPEHLAKTSGADVDPDGEGEVHV